jgi:DNA polymerase (family 10)
VKRKVGLAEAERAAAKVVAALSPFVERIEVAGSVRRRKQIVGDVDLIVGGVKDGFVSQLLGLGGEFAKVSGSVEVDGVTVEIEVMPIETWGAALQYRTGSMEENVRLRAIAKRRGMKLSQYGLVDRATGKLIAGRTEEEVYAALGEECPPPERREHVAGEAVQLYPPEQWDFECLECGIRFPEWLKLPVWYEGRVTTHKCPYCRGKIKKYEGEKK